MIETTHSNRILRNVVYGFSTWILPLFLGLVVTRVIVRSLGPGDYGIYALVLGFIAYSFNFSIGRAITKYLATYRASGETQKIRAMISSTALITLTVAVTGSLLVLGLSRWLVVDVFDIEPSSQDKTIAALQISAVTIFILMIGQVATAVLQGLHRFDVYSKIQNANSFIMMLGNLWLAYNGYGLLALLYWNLAVAAFTCIIAFAAARRLLPEFGIGFEFRQETVLLVLRYSAGVVGYQILTNAFFLFERSWIISRFGAESLTFYVIPMTLGIYLHSFIMSLSMFLFPLASELDQDRQRLLKLYRAATKSVLSVVVILATTIIALGKLFLTLWLGAEFGERSADKLIVHTVAFGLAAITIVSFQTAEALGRPGFNLRNMAIGVSVAVPLVILLTDTTGTLGVSFGRLVIFAVSFSAIFFLEKRTFGVAQTRFWVGALLRLAPAAGGAVVVERVLISNFVPGWPVFIAAVTAGTGVYLLLLNTFGFVADEDRHLIRRLVSREL